MITRERWGQKSPEQQWAYLDMLQRLYALSDNEAWPPIDPTDTGAIAILHEIEGIDDSDRGYGSTWW